MLPIKSVRAKTVLSTLIPSALVLIAVAIIALYAYERVAREAVQQRDTELARVSAARLSEALSQYSGILKRIATEDDVRSLDPARLSTALEEAQNQLYVFDGGVAIYDREGVTLWSQPFIAERQGMSFPARVEFDEVSRRIQPVFSDVFRDAFSGEEVILIGVPIVSDTGEFEGVLAGMFEMKYPLIGAIYAEVLQLKVGRSGYAYLVDGNGRVIYHPDGSQMGRDLGAGVPVMRAVGGETGAILTEDAAGESVISGYAPVPGTSWGLITQERWEDVIGPMRGYSRLLLGLLVVGGLISSLLIFFGTGRFLKPVRDLIQGAQRIAGGDFGHTITTKSGDEIQALAEQFNTMASSLKESYTDLEQRVAERTKELRESEERLRTVITSAPIVLFALDSKGVFTLSEGERLKALGLKPGEVVGRSAFDVYRDIPQIVDNTRRALAGEEFVSSVDVGELTFETRYSPLRSESGNTIGVIGVATDVTDRKHAERALQDLAVIEERRRLARELHDSVTQSLYSVTLFAEAVRRLVENADYENTEGYLEQLGETSQKALKEMRLLIYELGPAALKREGLVAALERRLNAVERRAGVEADLLVNGSIDLPKSVEEGLFRIAEEALNNALKHAASKSVTVQMRAEDRVVMLEVQDDGQGFDPRAVGGKGGMGLTSMRERAEELSGSLRVISAPGEGTKVWAQIELR